ncbi:hypothetical protein GMRT_10194 [Giardia muris]|uniref:Uncharacterized protein n=1 Tax=Giardia muris TaxID=5742 RepID=A0A4Z1SSW4_GIAMU|nr:hypothetical protein GMRT_10194 [Giardia muris]|eukprot:TNJ26738.1 hypothetical protein GMRT_10194 [Giardia muris]
MRGSLVNETWITTCYEWYRCQMYLTVSQMVRVSRRTFAYVLVLLAGNQEGMKDWRYISNVFGKLFDVGVEEAQKVAEECVSHASQLKRMLSDPSDPTDITIPDVSGIPNDPNGPILERPRYTARDILISERLEVHDEYSVETVGFRIDIEALTTEEKKSLQESLRDLDTDADIRRTDEVLIGVLSPIAMRLLSYCLSQGIPIVGNQLLVLRLEWLSVSTRENSTSSGIGTYQPRQPSTLDLDENNDRNTDVLLFPSTPERNRAHSPSETPIGMGDPPFFSTEERGYALELMGALASPSSPSSSPPSPSPSIPVQPEQYIVCFTNISERGFPEEFQRCGYVRGRRPPTRVWMVPDTELLALYVCFQSAEQRDACIRGQRNLRRQSKDSLVQASVGESIPRGAMPVEPLSVWYKGPNDEPVVTSQTVCLSGVPEPFRGAGFKESGYLRFWSCVELLQETDDGDPYLLILKFKKNEQRHAFVKGIENAGGRETGMRVTSLPDGNSPEGRRVRTLRVPRD